MEKPGHPPRTGTKHPARPERQSSGFASSHLSPRKFTAEPEGARIPPPQGWTTNSTFQASSKSGLKQEAAAQGRVPSGLPGHPAAPNWTLDGRVAAAGHQPRTPIPRGRSRHRQRHGPHLPAGPAGRRLGGAAQAPRESERARGHRLGSLWCRGVDGSLSCSPELPERVETAFNPS